MLVVGRPMRSILLGQARDRFLAARRHRAILRDAQIFENSQQRVGDDAPRDWRGSIS